jgi:hypothetical protein
MAILYLTNPTTSVGWSDCSPEQANNIIRGSGFPGVLVVDRHDSRARAFSARVSKSRRSAQASNVPYRASDFPRGRRAIRIGVAIFPSFSRTASCRVHSSARAASMKRLCCAALAGLGLSRNITAAQIYCRHARRPLIAQRPTESTHLPRVSVSAGGK